MSPPILLRVGEVTRFISDTEWPKLWRSLSSGPGNPSNRVTTMRMRDQRRWMFSYRRAAEDRALDEARHRSWRHRLFNLMYFTEHLLRDKNHE